MKERLITFVQFLVAALIGAFVCMWADRRLGHGKDPETVIIERVDTLLVHDTITVSKPTPVAVYVTDTLWYEVPVYKGRDTVYVEAPLPRTRKVYQDSTYRAVVSGFMPNLDTISVFRKTVYIDKVQTVYVQPSRWSVGVQAGYGASKDGLSPYIGVGIQYQIWAPKKGHQR